MTSTGLDPFPDKASTQQVRDLEAEFPSFAEYLAPFLVSGIPLDEQAEAIEAALVPFNYAREQMGLEEMDAEAALISTMGGDDVDDEDSSADAAT